SREQSSGIEQVNQAVMQMDQTTQQNAALVEQAASTSQAIVEQAQALTMMISRYHVVAEDESRARATPVERRTAARPWVAGTAQPKGAAPAAAVRRPAAAAPKTAAMRKAGVAAGGDAEWQEF
ncbi:MAG TPA: hypothetical protein VN859_00485, partial [Steroidobacteraceae bacterium]|nr:hypothetical protein [Steroidobacteraceae bacterium]